MTLGLNTTLSSFLDPVDSEWCGTESPCKGGNSFSSHGCVTTAGLPVLDNRVCAASYVRNEGVTRSSDTILKHATPMSTTHLKNKAPATSGNARVK